MQMTLIMNLGIFILGLALLIYGSDVFVESASRFAKGIGVSELFIGLTIVAIGTSLPEIVSSSTALLAGKSQLAFGNVIGSTLTNLTLIVGVSAVISPLASNAIVIERDAKVMILIIGVLAVTLLDPITPGTIVFWEAGILLLLFFAYLSFLFTGKEDCESCYQFRVFVDYLIRLRFLTSLRGLTTVPSRLSKRNHQQQMQQQVQVQQQVVSSDVQESSLSKDAFQIVASAIFIVLGAFFVVTGSDFITTTWGIQESVIGLAVIALATSLPELTVSMNSAKRGFGRLLIGNVIGSNIVNVTLGLGIVSLFIPSNIGLTIGIGLIIAFAVGVSLIFFYVIRKDWRVTKTEGLMLLLLFIVSQVVLVFFSQVAA
ncbi:MAG: calcium/sodium antiporter [Candidatus Thorarchaeota archaeon]|jgi:cation:H+ antiporter